MAETEQQMIGRLLAPLSQGLEGAFGLKDDAAALAPPEGHEFVISMDTVTAGLHFLFDGTPKSAAMAAHKALAVNVSDLSAKGAEPYAYFLSLSLPCGFSEWLDEFVSTLSNVQNRWGLHLAGGDTVRSHQTLSITITVMGIVPEGEMIRRSTARAGDQLFVSGTIGDAVAGLYAERFDERTGTWRKILSPSEFASLASRTRTPEPRVVLIPALRQFASASLDVSDGLALDAARMAQASGLGVAIEGASVPFSSTALKLLDNRLMTLEELVTGGDDYEILAAVAPGDVSAFITKAEESQVQVTRIGELTTGQGLMLYDAVGERIALKKLGFEHLG